MKSVLLFTVAALLLSRGNSIAAVENLKGFHRSGQTFLTWREDSTVQGELYKIYRDTVPFSASSDLLQRKLIATLPEDTSVYYTDLCRGVLEQESYVPLTRYIIRDSGKQLAAGTGLLVATTKQTGSYFYAITEVINNKENKSVSADTTTNAITEQVVEAQPVLVWKSADGLNRIYTHWMDFQTWNNTYDTPREINNYCGFSPDPTPIRRAVQYAYSYLVSFPPGYNPAGTKEYPLTILLHAYSERYISRGDPGRFGWQVIELVPDDPNSSWWYGFTEKTDYRSSIPVQGPVVNFTEMRVLEELRQVQALPDVHVDSRKIYAHGQSMGGTGALALGMRYPEIFSQVYAGQPHTNFNQAVQRFHLELKGKWGDPQLGLKISNRGSAAVSLQRYDGTRVWDWQNFPTQILRRKSDDMSFMMVDHGTLDTTAPLQLQGVPFYNALQSTKRAYYAAINSSPHVWQNFLARGFNGFSLTDRVFPLAKEASIGFTSPAGSSIDPFYSRLFEWAGTVRKFGALMEDTETKFAVTVRTNFRELLVADVTPRGTANFHPLADQKFKWTNRSLKSGTTLQSGNITVNTRDLITLPRIQIEPTGNRLEIERRN